MRIHTRTISAGSPPRMRGKEEFACKDGSQVGITPAHAGKRQHQELCPRVGRDHPRACGEKKLLNHSDPSISGSPPRMRGKAREIKQKFDNDGITPAHAGKS